jgi:type I restriction enzyme S subunit
VAIASTPLATNQGFKSLVLKEGYLPEFYFYVMKTKKPEMESVAGGSTFKEISGRVMKTIRVPAPPLDEQRAIAEVLGALDERIELALQTHRLQASLLRAYADSRSALLEFNTGGFALTVGGDWGADEADEAHTEQVFCLRGKDLEDILAGSRVDVPVRHLKPSSLGKRELAAGDVLTAGSGTLGPALLITSELLAGFSLPVTYSNFVKRIRPEGPQASSVALFATLLSMWDSGAIDQYRTGTAMPNLDAKSLASTVVTPALDASQREKAAVLAESLLGSTHIALAEYLTSIRDALLPKLVSGEVRIPDPQALLEPVG